MSLEKAAKLKTPKMPADLDDKEIDKALKAFDKTVAPMVKAVDAARSALTAALQAHTALEAAVDKKFNDAKLDAKAKKAIKDLYTEVNGIKRLLMDVA